MVVDDLERLRMIEADLGSNTKIEQGTSLCSHFHNVMILKGLQISFCDVDILMPQQSGHRIEIQPVPQTGLCKIVACGVGRAANILSNLCLLVCLIEDVFQCFFRKGSPGSG